MFIGKKLILSRIAFAYSSLPSTPTSEHSTPGNSREFPGVECSLVGVLGNDEYAKAIRDRISFLPINTEFLRTVPGETAHNSIFHSSDGDRYFLSNSWSGGVFDCFTLGKDELNYLRDRKSTRLNSSH